MTDRALIFCASLVIAICALGAAVWLVAAGQVGTFDGNFLLLSALVLAFAFGLYLKFMISRAMGSAPPAASAKPAVKPEPAKAAKPEIAAPVANQPVAKV